MSVDKKKYDINMKQKNFSETTNKNVNINKNTNENANAHINKHEYINKNIAETSTTKVTLNNDNPSLLNFFNKKFNKPLTEHQILIIYFFIYAVLGWILETIYCVYELGHFEKRGFLYGPLCPIYGYGAIILLVILKPFKNKNLLLFIYSAVVFSVFEYLVGYSLEALFSMKFWDYTNDVLNINGRITLWFSVIWGIFGVLFMNYIHKFTEKITEICKHRINYVLQHIVLYAIMIVYAVDTLLSIIRYMN